MDTVLLGDSSLGNAIDAEQFSRETGTHTVSLALTGLYGYAGSANMLDRAVEVYPNLRNVVVINTPDMMSRSPSYRGWLLTLGSAGRLLELDRGIAIGIFAELGRMTFSKDISRHLLSQLSLNKKTAPPQLISNDYIIQSDKIEDFSPLTLTPESIQPRKTQELRALVREAERNGFSVVYAHGPLWDASLDSSSEYLAVIDKAIASTGVTFVHGIEALPAELLGDSEDHVAPRIKPLTTTRYAARLQTYLH